MLRPPNEEVSVHTSRLAQLAIIVAGISLSLYVGSILLVQLGAVSPLAGFQLHMLGAVIGPVALLIGLFALFTTRPASGRAGRGLALGAACIGALMLVLVLATAGPSAGVPPINDITTAPDDPPAFVVLTREEANVERDMGYPGEEFASQQRAGYPDLAPIEVTTSVADTLDRVKASMEEFGWDVVHVDADAGRIEAMDVSRLFLFVDDIVVRVRPKENGAMVDVRSKSRDGKSDLGANAARIRQLRDALQ